MSMSLRVALVVLAILGAAVIAFVFNAIATYDRYRVPSESMVPTLDVGTRVALNRRAYSGDTRPALGDIVIFHPPAGAEVNECAAEIPAGQMCAEPKGGASDIKFIKRVVAGPGDRVSMEGGALVRDGERVDEPYIAACEGADGCDFPTEITLPADHYLMIGDNRGASDDSRFWGPVPEAWILGRVEDCTLVIAVCSPRR